MVVGDLVKAIGGADKGRIGLVQGFRDNQRKHDAYIGVQPDRWATVQWADKPDPGPHTFYVPIQLLRVISKS